MSQGDLFDTPDNLEYLRRASNEKATLCKCCGRISKVYRFRLGSFSRFLVWLLLNEDHDNDRWLHAGKAPDPEARNGGGDYAKLEWWGLTERHPKNDDPTKKSSGYWRLTDKGRLFVMNEVTAPSHAFYVAPSEVLGLESEVSTIVDALGKHFNYAALMRGEW